MSLSSPFLLLWILSGSHRPPRKCPVQWSPSSSRPLMSSPSILHSGQLCSPLVLSAFDSLQGPGFGSHSLSSPPPPSPVHLPSCLPTSSMKPALPVQFFPLLSQAWVDNEAITNSCLRILKEEPGSCSGWDRKRQPPGVLQGWVG